MLMYPNASILKMVSFLSPGNAGSSEPSLQRIKPGIYGCDPLLKELILSLYRISDPFRLLLADGQTFVLGRRSAQWAFESKSGGVYPVLRLDGARNPSSLLVAGEVRHHLSAIVYEHKSSL